MSPTDEDHPRLPRNPGELGKSGLLDGVVLFAVGIAFHFAVPVLAPRIAGMYRSNSAFRPWSGGTRAYMMVHPFAFGFLFAWAHGLWREQGGGMAGGARFGGLLFVAGALPIYLLVFASLAIPLEVAASWVIQGLAQYIAAGAALGRLASRADRGVGDFE